MVERDVALVQDLGLDLKYAGTGSVVNSVVLVLCVWFVPFQLIQLHFFHNPLFSVHLFSKTNFLFL